MGVLGWKQWCDGRIFLNDFRVIGFPVGCRDVNDFGFGVRCFENTVVGRVVNGTLGWKHFQGAMWSHMRTCRWQTFLNDKFLVKRNHRCVYNLLVFLNIPSSLRSPGLTWRTKYIEGE